MRNSVVEKNKESIRTVSATSFPGCTVDQHFDAAADRLSTTISLVGTGTSTEACGVFLALLRQRFPGLDFHSGGLQVDRTQARSTLMVHAEEVRVIGGLLTARNRRIAGVVTAVIYILLLLLLMQFANFERAPWTLPGQRHSHVSHVLKWVQSELLASWRS